MWVLDRGKSLVMMTSHMLLMMMLSLLVSLESLTAASSMNSMKTSYACQGSKLNLSCPSGFVIKIMRANYGRFSVAICNEAGITDWSVNCMAPRSLRILQDRCNLEHECEISAESNNFGGDPCPDVPKYLEVYFGCFRETSTSTTTTPNPLPPWLTTRSTISFYPGLFDLDITPPPRRVPYTAPPETTTVSATTEALTTKLIQTFPTEVVTTVNQHMEEQLDSAAEITETAGNRSSIARKSTTMPIAHPSEKEISTMSSTTRKETEPSTPTSEDEIAGVESDKLLYTSDRSNNDTVKIILSTLPPMHDKVKNNISPSVSPHSGTVSPLSMCPPRNIRALSWSWTGPGREAILACPQGTSGLARWSCVGAGHGKSTPHWSTPSPDLSQCTSVWMEKIIRDLKKSELIINLASDLMQYVSANALYGGDVKSAIDAMTIIAEKMQYQLRSIPTMEQREAMVMELVQSVTKTASSLLSDHNIPAWQDLPVGQQNRFLSNFIVAIEKTGSLLPGAVALDQEVSMSSDNLLLTVRKISFRNIRGTFFPSLASLATPFWKDYSDNIEIPAVVLMENMNSEGSQVVFLSLRNLEKLLVPSESNKTIRDFNSGSRPTAKQVVNSQVIHLSFGDSERVQINEPVTMIFKHKNVGNVTNPRCVQWDRGSESWNSKFCELVFTNLTHSQCECSRIGTFALLEEIEQTDGVARMTFLVMVIIAISVSIIAFISLVLLFVYCHRIKVQNHLKIKLNKADLSCFKNKKKCWSLNDTPTLSEDLFPDGNGEAFDIVRNSDFMVLSRAALAAHDTNESHISQDFSRTIECLPGPQVQTRPRHLDVAKCPRTGTMYTNVSCRMSSPVVYPNAQTHIYMEVDPLYSGFAHNQLLSTSEGQFLEGDTGLVSSNSSQTSSGYSTAPSEFNRNSHHLYEVSGDVEYVDNLHEHPFEGQILGSRCLPFPGQPSHDYLAKDTTKVYSISEACEVPQSVYRDRDRYPVKQSTGPAVNVRKPELVMNHPLLMRGGERQAM